jgi:hypothetical protein
MRSGRTAAMSVVLLALTLAACISGPARQATHDLGGSDHTGVDVSHANSSIADPPYFVYESEGGTIELRSPSSGAVTDVLEKVGQTITSNGLAESADGRDVYVTLIGKTNLYIEQISGLLGFPWVFDSGRRESRAANADAVNP